ncbi:MAG: methionyl-tRNA formyltransferase [Bdellovibrionales bacterium GWA2_49_15]|nr:MAG: methionyl-tRNA formyltransferase [Bdellovibrionales bacterium GWA2_49_15]
MSNKIFKTAFFGTPDFSVPALEMLANHPNINLRYVVCSPDRPAGRGLEIKPQPIAQYAIDNKIPFFQTANVNKEDDFLQKLDSETLDLIIVIAFSQFLGSRILALPHVGAFNVHTSILPKYRGASPIQHALLHGDSSTGVTVQKMVKKMDAGDIFYQSTLPISPEETFPELYTRLKFASALAIHDFVQIIAEQGLPNPTIQDEAKVSFAPIIDKALGHLNFLTSTTKGILNKIRALNPWPSTFCFINGQRVKILKASLPPYGCVAPGKIDSAKHELLIGCADGTLKIERVCPEGKKEMSAEQFLVGLRAQNNLTLG